MSIADALITDLQHESKVTRKMLEIAPANRFDWRPHEKSWTLAELCSHLAESPAWISSMLDDEMDFAAMGDYKPFVGKDPGAVVAAYDENLAAGLSFIRGKEDAVMRATWTMRKGDEILMQQPRHAVIRSIAIHHTIHHRGQLSVYLRLLDVPLPPVYGPTADHPGFSDDE